MAQLNDTWSGTMDVGDPVDGPALDSILDAVRASVNSVDNTQIAVGAAIATSKLDLGVILHWLGVATGIKVIFGSKAVTLDNTTWNGGGVAAVDFTTDADTYGTGAATDFTTAPVVVVTPVAAEGASPLRYVTSVTGVGTTGFTIVVETSDVAASTATVTVYWIAIGAA